MSKVLSIALFNAALIAGILGLGLGRASVSLGQPAQKARPKMLSGEATAKAGSTNVNFEETTLNGTVKSPVGIDVGATKPDRNYDFVKIRLRWHPEMLQSAGHIDN